MWAQAANRLSPRRTLPLLSTRIGLGIPLDPPAHAEGAWLCCIEVESKAQSGGVTHPGPYREDPGRAQTWPRTDPSPAQRA